jgi:hypothetical protein
MSEWISVTIRNNNGGENGLQLELIKQLGEEGYVQQLYDFFQGKYFPPNITITDEEKPNLTAIQAWYVLYCLQEHFGMLDDRFERCCKCGKIYDSYDGGTTIDNDSEPKIITDNSGNESKHQWEKSEYGNYCDYCRPD